MQELRRLNVDPCCIVCATTTVGHESLCFMGISPLRRYLNLDEDPPGRRRCVDGLDRTCWKLLERHKNDWDTWGTAHDQKIPEVYTVESLFEQPTRFLQDYRRRGVALIVHMQTIRPTLLPMPYTWNKMQSTHPKQIKHWTWTGANPVYFGSGLRFIWRWGIKC